MSGNEKGFTLLETMIAMAIMLVAFSAILAVESGAINASNRAKQLNVVAMLARNKMIDIEYDFEGKTFEEYKKEQGAGFEAPYEDYRWTAVVKEIKFPQLNFGGGGGGDDKGGGAEASQATDAVNTMSKLVSQFLSQALREVTVTIFWKKGPKEQSFAVSTYWVDLNHEFKLSE